jgi:hypothetical protein
MAARVLAEAYRHVTDVERDHLPEVSEARKSVAQGSDAHALSTGGARVSQELLSRLLNDLVVNGPPTVANLSECIFSPGGHVLCQNEHSPPIVSYQPSRPHPERFAGNRLRRLPNDELVERQDLVALTASPGRDRVTGVQHRPIATGKLSGFLRANLVSTRPKPGCVPYLEDQPQTHIDGFNQ